MSVIQIVLAVLFGLSILGLIGGCLNWRSKVKPVQQVRNWVGRRQEERRIQRDPEYRQRRACYDIYNRRVLRMTCQSERLAKIAKRLEDEPDGSERAAIESEYLDLKQAVPQAIQLAGSYLASLTDEDIRQIAAYDFENTYGRLITVDELAAFMRDERELCRANPEAVIDHVPRSATRFARLYRLRRDGQAAEK